MPENLGDFVEHSGHKLMILFSLRRNFADDNEKGERLLVVAQGEFSNQFDPERARGEIRGKSFTSHKMIPLYFTIFYVFFLVSPSS